ncbi:MAG: ABC transporter ATP-binding protein [Burkholderiales bacterium]|nr:ABC transporter ATP-binding protein [Burkholderiales bacterium]
MTTPVLAVRNIETWYGPVNAIRGINLEVRPGRMVAVLGANGAGKTTLLNTIAGVLRPAKGRIDFGGQRIDGLDADQVARAGVVLVPEGRQLFPFLTVAENLRLGAFARRDNAGIASDLDRIYSWFPRLAERSRQPAGLLSGGEQQMVAIGRALMGRPRLLLLDEPSLGLSPLFTKEIFGIVRRVSLELAMAVLVVEQNAALALETADDGYVIELGRVALDGTCAELMARDDVRDFYLGGAQGGHTAAQRPRSHRQQPTWR